MSDEVPNEPAEECLHEWVVVVQTVAHPQPHSAWPLGEVQVDIIREFSQGVTRTLLKCDLCGELRRELIYGVPRK